MRSTCPVRVRAVCATGLMAWLAMPVTALAGPILIPTDGGATQVQDAEPIGQSFTAEDAFVFAALYFRAINPSEANTDPLEYRLYEGNGTGGDLLASTTFSLLTGFTGFHHVDFSAAALAPGNVYSLVALVDGTSPHWGVGTAIDYAGGDLILSGLPYERDDLALSVIPVPNTAVPEPSSLLLLGTGLASLGLGRRGRGRRQGAEAKSKKAHPRVAVPLLALLLVTPASASEAPAKEVMQSSEMIGILPFDASASEGHSRTASNGLANLLRAEMVRDGRFVPKLIELPPGKRPPLPPAETAALGAAAGVDLVLAGSVLSTDVDRKSVGVRSGGRLNRIGAGGRVGRNQVTIELMVHLVDPDTGSKVQSFEVSAESSEFTGSTDVWSEIGRFDFDDTDWARTPVAKALQKAARDIINKVAEHR